VITGLRAAKAHWTAVPNAQGALALAGLVPLMARSSGRREVMVALVDGPVEVSHPGLATECIVEIPGGPRGTCARARDPACVHGTSVAGILTARRGSSAPAICPGCTLLLRPIFAEAASGDVDLPTATPEDLAEAIIDVVEAGARVVNLSIALARVCRRAEQAIEAALDHALRHGVLVVAAAGNGGMLGGSAITRHPGVIPVAAGDRRGRPMTSNLGLSIGRKGLTAPGDTIVSLAAGGGSFSVSGTSAAAPFVTAAIALLWSEFPAAPAAQVKYAVTQSYRPLRHTIVPPLLNAWAAYCDMLVRAATAGEIGAI
jgi:subtilisin family serine protease